ncbi:MAG: hypothetical protein ACK4N5_26975, partial [Myxococcales bacterium]
TNGTTVIADLDYGSTAGWASHGVAVNLSSATLAASASQKARYWCAATATLSGGDKGSPGAENDACGMVVNAPVDYCVLQAPTNAGTVEAPNTVTVYGQFYEPNVTNRNTTGNDDYPHLVAELGYGLKPTTGQPDPTTWTWVPAAFNAAYVDNDPFNDRDEVQATLAPTAAGEYLYGFRMRLKDPATGALSAAVYCDANGVATTPAAGTWGRVTILNVAAEIAAVRAHGDGQNLNLPINNALV